MAPFNITAISQMTEPQVITYCHQNVAIFPLITMFIVIFFIFAMCGIGLFENKRKFWNTWLLALVISLFVLAAYLFLPLLIHGIQNLMMH